MKAMIYGAGGGTSSDEVTALKKHVLSPYTTITNDSGDEIVAGTMVDNGAVNRSLKCGESYTIVEGFHNGSGVISADSLASQTGANAAAGDILTGKTAWVNGIKLTGTLPTMAGGTKTPSTSQITVACSGYKMTSNIIIPAFSLPSANVIKKGTKVTIYGKSVTGTWEGYVTSPLYLFNNGKWSNLQTTGFSGISGDGAFFVTDNLGAFRSSYNRDKNYFRLNQTINTSSYTKLKVNVNSVDTLFGDWYWGVSTNPSLSSYSSLTKLSNTGVQILNISSGNYYIYFVCIRDGSGPTSTNVFLKISQLFLSAT